MAAVFTANVFRQDAFSGLTLTDQINKNPYIPTILGDMAIFEPKPILTTGVQIDAKQGILSLIPTTPRGAPMPQRIKEKRNARYFECPRLAKEDTIYASEIQNVRNSNEEMMLQDLATEVFERLEGPTGLKMQMNYTWENHRLGAVQGVLLDADGSVIFNWYNEFGIPIPADIGFNLGTTHATGSVRALCSTVRRIMTRAGQGAFMPSSEIHALCGDAFWDLFINDPDVTQFYVNYIGAQALLPNRAFDMFYFQGIYWHNYRGSDDNSTVAVATNSVKFFPVKAPGVFRVFYAPGEGFPDVNALGRPLNVYRDIDPSEEQAWVNYKVKSFPLHICTRPEMLLSGHAGP